MFEAYAKDNFSRMTMLMDKHEIEANSKPSLEFYYYTGSDHSGASYGNTKIGSDVAFHSFCFDRDRMTAYGSIDACMPITLAKISLTNDLNTAYKNIAAADAAFEPETAAAQHNRCLKYIALRKAENGAMFYDVDRHQVACKIGDKWCALPFTVIEDAAFDILDASKDTDVEWASGVIDGNGGIVENAARLYTIDCLESAATSVTANEGYEFCVVPYSEDGAVNAPTPYYDPSTGNMEGTVVYYTQVDLTFIDLEGFPNYRLIARRTDLGNISPSEGSNIVISTAIPEEPADTGWKNGIIDGNGNIAENTARLYTPDYISETTVSVTANEGYEFCVVPYNADGITNAPNPYYDPSTGSFSTSGALWYTSVDLTAIDLGTGWVETENVFDRFKLIVRRTDLGDISPSEGINIVIA